MEFTEEEPFPISSAKVAEAQIYLDKRVIVNLLTYIVEMERFMLGNEGRRRDHPVKSSLL